MRPLLDQGRARWRQEDGFATSSIALMWWIALIAMPFVYAVIVGVIWVGNAEQGVSNLAKQMGRAYVLAPTSKGPGNAEHAALEVWDASGCALFNVCAPHATSTMADIPPDKGRCNAPRITASGYGAHETVHVEVTCDFIIRLPGGVTLTHTFAADNTQIFEANRFPAG